MIINKIHVDAFGALKDLTLELTDGLNIIQGENESGKSTLSAFIKFIFYGLDTKERVKYFPWDGSVAGGTEGSHRRRQARRQAAGCAP